MVPMPMPRVQPKQLAIENQHPQDVHIEPVQPKFHRMGPTPHQQPIQTIQPNMVYHRPGMTPDPNATYHPGASSSSGLAHPGGRQKRNRSGDDGKVVDIPSSGDEEPPAKASATTAKALQALSKAKQAEAAYKAEGTPPKPTSDMALYKLDVELAKAYKDGLKTDPED